MSVIIATILVPSVAQRYRSPRRGLKQTILLMIAFNLIYMTLYLTVWPRLLWNG